MRDMPEAHRARGRAILRGAIKADVMLRARQIACGKRLEYVAAALERQTPADLRFAWLVAFPRASFVFPASIPNLVTDLLGAVVKPDTPAPIPLEKVVPLTHPSLDWRVHLRPYYLHADGSWNEDAYIVRSPHHRECQCVRCKGGRHAIGCFCAGSECRVQPNNGIPT